ncbi:hypothetical protein [Pedobacter frigoris]|uniref:hypothetical protein n=1 Tax=Pedobacter frigoris TaxID=2571272 RepID=UPI00292F9D95|nr:hypothetical protein [Pedobacter frigoris]
MKDSIKYSFLLAHRVISVFLVLIFLSLSAIQVFHHHDGHGLLQEKGKSQFHASEKCDICDYFVRHHGKVIHAFTPIVLLVALAEAITIDTPVDAGICKFALPGFSNRGPPYFA